MASRAKKKNQLRGNVTTKELPKKQIKQTWIKKNLKPIILVSSIVIFLVIAIVGIASAKSQGDYGSIVYGNPTIVYLGSTDCAPCRQLQPVMESLGEKYDGEINIKFYDSWNTTEGARLATRYSVTSIPTLIFTNSQNQELARITGYNSQSVIEEKLRELGWV